MMISFFGAIHGPYCSRGFETEIYRFNISRIFHYRFYPRALKGRDAYWVIFSIRQRRIYSTSFNKHTSGHRIMCGRKMQASTIDSCSHTATTSSIATRSSSYIQPDLLGLPYPNTVFAASSDPWLILLTLIGCQDKVSHVHKFLV